MPTWHLIDATELAARYKFTFFKPTLEVICKVKTGELVRLMFGCRAKGQKEEMVERMWVLIDQVAGDGNFSGTLCADAVCIEGLNFDQRVEFCSGNIINTEHDDDRQIQKYLARCFVSRLVLQSDSGAGYVYRETPDRGDDSGWRVLTGKESRSYLDDPGNIAYLSLGTVLNRDDSLIGLLDHSIGSAFRKNSEQYPPIWDTVRHREHSLPNLHR